MRMLPVVELEIVGQLYARFGDAFIRMQIHVPVLDAASEPFDEDVIDPAALAVHADLDGVVGQHLGEIGAGELAALVGIEDLRYLAIASSSASTQKSVVMLIDTRCARTLRVAQSRMATR